MLISILVPVYNVQDYLPGCLESILANDLQGCEIVLVDDGATDRSGAICDDYAARYPELFRVVHQPNGGIGEARNTCLREAKGDWLLFVDSDDKVRSDMITILKSAAERSDTDIIGFQFFADNGVDPPVEESSGIGSCEQPFTLNQKKEYLLTLPSLWLRLWRRSLFTESGLTFPPLVWYEDFRMVSKILPLAKGIRILDEPLYYYLRHTGSIMINKKLPRNREILEAMDDILAWYRGQGIFEDYRTELEALTVQHVLLAASARVARVDPKHPLLREFYDYTERNFPEWRKNPYNKQLPKSKRLALSLIRHRCYRTLKLLFKMKG